MNLTFLRYFDTLNAGFNLRKSMRKTFLYEARLNNKTTANANQWLETCRRLYNIALDQRISIYRQDRKTISVYDQANQLPDLKAAYPEFKTVGSQVLQDVLERLDKAYKSFFRRVKQKGQKAGFPRFKGYARYDSFTLKQAGWKLAGRHLTIARIGKFKLFLSRPIEGDIKTITVRRVPGGKWLVAFSCDNVPEKRLPASDREVGIDVGIKSFCVDSDGGIVENPAYFSKYEQVLRRRQRALARKKKGSKNRAAARVLVAKTHAKIANQRRDFLHKVANAYIKDYGTISVEDLKIQNMIQNRNRNFHLSKSISDASWGKFFEFLSCKAEEAGRTVIKVAPHGTSQICSGCGEKVPKTLSVRTHRCPYCSLTMDRDLNASINILQAGQACQALTP
jgi:putative transposase